MPESKARESGPQTALPSLKTCAQPLARKALSALSELSNLRDLSCPVTFLSVSTMQVAT